jgi:hypothetical protein
MLRDGERCPKVRSSKAQTDQVAGAEQMRSLVRWAEALERTGYPILHIISPPRTTF